MPWWHFLPSFTCVLSWLSQYPMPTAHQTASLPLSMFVLSAAVLSEYNQPSVRSAEKGLTEIYLRPPCGLLRHRAINLPFKSARRSPSCSASLRICSASSIVRSSVVQRLIKGPTRTDILDYKVCSEFEFEEFRQRIKSGTRKNPSRKRSDQMAFSFPFRLSCTLTGHTNAPFALDLVS